MLTNCRWGCPSSPPPFCTHSHHGSEHYWQVREAIAAALVSLLYFRYCKTVHDNDILYIAPFSRIPASFFLPGMQQTKSKYSTESLFHLYGLILLYTIPPEILGCMPRLWSPVHRTEHFLKKCLSHQDGARLTCL